MWLRLSVIFSRPALHNFERVSCSSAVTVDFVRVRPKICRGSLHIAGPRHGVQALPCLDQLKDQTIHNALNLKASHRPRLEMKAHMHV